MEKEHFNVSIKDDIEQIHIFLNSNKYKNIDVDIIIKDIDSNILWIGKTKFLNDDFYWYEPNNFNNYNGFIIEIFQSDNKIFENIIRLKDIHGEKIEKQCLFIGNIGGMGDHFSAEPLLRKISKMMNQKLIVFTYYPDIFINHPCIEKLIKIETHYQNEDIIKNIPEEYSNEKIRFTLRLERDKFGFLPYWNTIDLRQWCSFQVGISLKKEELDYHFYPEDFENIEELPNRYVLINPSITEPHRTWNLENWQKLVDILNDNNIYVVVIGKEIEIFNKSFYNIKIKKGINLCGDERQNNLSQVWHIINKSDMFVTFDTGMFILAGSTDTFILQIGSSLDPEYHRPVRNGSEYYKYDCVEGNCKIKCFSDLKYSIQWSGSFGNISGNQEIGYCVKEYVQGNNFDCHPKPEIVSKRIIEILSN